MSETELRLQEMPEDKRRFRIMAGAFLGTVGGIAAIFGFSRTLMASKHEEQKLLEKGLIEGPHLLDAGSSLARRALGYGTLFALLGTGSLCFGIWKLSGANNMNEFRHKMGTLLPKLSKDGPPTSRTEFDGLSDFMEYVSTWQPEAAVAGKTPITHATGTSQQVNQ